jgi:myxalamid-type polyketide synthase MxaE and MxaD
MTTLEAASFFDEIGLEAMQPEQALEALGSLMAGRSIQNTVAAIDWNLFQPVYEARRRRPLLERIQPAPSASRGLQPGRPSLALRLESVPAPKRWDLLLAEVRSEAAAVLGFRDPETLELREGFFQMGMDSLTSVDLKRRLEACLDRALPTTLAFEYPTVDALAGYLYRDVLGFADEDRGTGASDPQRGGLLSAVEQLSEEDARRALFEELGQMKRDLR